MVEKLDYISSQPAHRRIPIAAIAIVAGLTLVLNGILIAMMVSDPGFGAMGIGLMVVSPVNGALLILFVACIPLVKRAPGTSITLYLIFSLGLPLAAIPFDLLISHP